MDRADIDRNLLFGVLALQRDMITQDQFAEACAVWALRMDRPLADVLIGRGALTADDRRDVERDIDRKLRRFGGDVRASLGAVADAAARDAIRRVDDPEVRRSLSSLPPAAGYVMLETVAHAPSSENGRYSMSRLHAEGGLGEVWVARDNDLNREVALKIIKPEKSRHPEMWRRFFKEAQITGQLEHPNIVPVYELARKPGDDQPFYTMRFVRGRTLHDAIRDYHKTPDDRLAFQALLGAFIAVCRAVAYAHSRGVIHRDLKPANIVLGGFGEVIVLDWGLAKLVDRPEEGDESEPPLALGDDAATAATRGRVGTPSYMAPEQVEERHDLIDARTDVYALGAILFEILTNRPPAVGTTLDEVFRAILAGAVPRARDLNPAAPRPLEAIATRALARDRSKRYVNPLDLADDVRRWIADEPVSAHREPWATRARRWMARHRTLVTASAAAMFVALAAVGYVLYDLRLRAAQRLTAARGRVEALATAQVRSLPLIVEQLGADRALVRDRLRAMAAPGAAEQGRLAAALALLPDDPAQADVLADRLRKPEATPDEVLVLRDALAANPQAERVAGRLRGAVPAKAAELTDEQLRALGALAAMAPKDPLHTAHAASIARKLVRENPLLIGSWREVFQPIAAALADPLRTVYADRSAAEPRALAYTLLFEFATRPGNATEAEDLSALIADADPDQFRQLVRRLDSAANRARAVAFLAPKVKEPARFDDDLARRQGRWAMAVLRLGKAEAVWPLFRHRDDPSLRTELIHNLVRFDFQPGPVIDRLRGEGDVSARRALILCLGEFPVESIPDADRRALAERFLAWYRTDPDPGVHGGLDWLLRRWGRGPDLARIDADLASPKLPTDRDWYVNGQGQTYTLIRGPVEFRMGSTKQSDPDRDPDEIQHLRRIERSFAIATREVTLAEYARFLDDVNDPDQDYREVEQFKQQIPSPDCAIGAVTWYEAARYCNWLSAKEGIPEDQWCYPKKIGPGMTLPKDYLERTGYRLPTEGEWEYACRAGAASARPYGRAESWLVEYGWLLTNSGRTMHPAGRLKPNDLGLFDVLGNALEWCSDPYGGAYKPGADGKIINTMMDAEFSDNIDRVLRGGTFDFTASLLRAACRLRSRPSFRFTLDGFRPSRTYH